MKRALLCLITVLVARGGAAAPSFVGRIAIPVPGVSHAATGDLDGDSFLDIAAVSANDARLYIYYGRGDGLFVFPPDTYPTDSSPVFVAIGDLTDDGRTTLPDVLVVTTSGTIPPPANSIQGDLSIFTNSGGPPGTLSRFLAECPDIYLDGSRGANGNQPAFAVLRSMDADTRLDIVASTEFGNALQMLFQGFSNLSSGCAVPQICGFGFAQSPNCTPAGTGSVNPRPLVVGSFMPALHTNPDVVSLNTGSDPAIIRYHLHVNPDRNNLTTLIGAGSIHIYRVGNGTTTGVGARMLVADQLNADTIPDLIAADSISHEISVLEALPTGGLNSPVFRQPSVEYPANENPVWLATGEYRTGGATTAARDVVVANRSIDMISLLPGLGVSGFLSPMCYPAGSSPSIVASADFNQDTLDDALVVNSGSGSVSVLLGRSLPNEGFDVAVRRRTGGLPAAIAALNLDGALGLDAVAINADQGTLAALLGQNNGTFEEVSVRPLVGPGPTALAGAAFDADALDDVAVVTPTPGTVHLFLSMGNGTLRRGAPISVPDGSSTLAALRIDAGTTRDLAVGSVTSNRLTTLLGAGDGTFAPGPLLSLPVGRSVLSLASADFDSANGDDLATLEIPDNEIGLWLNDGAGGFTRSVALFMPVGAPPNEITTGDLNGDGRVDLAVTHDNGRVSVMLGDGTGSFALPLFWTLPDATISPRIGSFLPSPGGEKDLLVLMRNTETAVIIPWSGTGLDLMAAESYGTGISPAAATGGRFDTTATHDFVLVADSSLPSDGHSVTVLGNRRLISFPFADAGPDSALCAGSAGVPIGSPGKPFVTYAWNPTAGLSNPNAANPTATQSGTYTVTAMGHVVTGLSGTDSVTVTLVPSPTPSITPDPATYCTGRPPLVLDAGTGFASYLWSPGGETTQTIQVSPASPTLYTVMVTSTGGCSGSDSLQVGQGELAPALGSITPAAQCASVPPPTVFNAVATSVPPIGSTLTYLWALMGAPTGWSIAAPTAATTTISAAAGATANVTVRLTVTTQPGGCSSSLDFALSLLPSGSPSEIRNGLRARRLGTDVELSWQLNGSSRYDAYRVIVKTLLPGIFGTPSIGNTAGNTLAVTPATDLEYYQAQGVCP